MSAAAPVTVAVVSYNTRELLMRCLRALAPDAHAARADVWVIDNGSRDGSPEAARAEAPWATVLSPGSNLGFGRAVNLVAERTSAPWLLCANADVELEPGALAAMLAAGADGRVGAVAPRLVLPDGRTQHSVHSLPTLGFSLAFNVGAPALSRRLADGMLLEGRYDPERVRDVAWAFGAALLVRRQAFEAIGRFDERQWMYAEDLDLGWRLRDGGWALRYEPRARVRHASGAATAPAFGDTRQRRFMRETYAVIARRRGPRMAQAIAAINVAGAAARVGWMTPPALVSRRWRTRRRETLAWVAAHREGLHADGEGMRRFWNDRAREDAFYFVDTRQPYKAADPARFWDAEALVDHVLDGLGVRLAAGDAVVEIGCGLGRITRVLAARARSVVALDVSDEMLARARAHNPDLDNVEWVLGDGRSLAPVPDGSVDACVSLVVLQHVPDPQVTLDYVRDLGRALRPGGWAALQVSDDPVIHRARQPVAQRLLAAMGRAPGGQRHPAWLGSRADLDAIEATARESGLEVERVWGRGSQYCQLLLRGAR
ncbi:MAG TPA: methyltransferase domain-containing protein [Solirubrobacteraceae bacterium]|nr:methyltransferase domain-containing protein [Solirubrobacteraceae bacterium]